MGDPADIKQDMCVTKSTKKDVRRFCKDEFAEKCDPPPPQPASPAPMGTCEWYGLVPKPAWIKDKEPEFDVDVSGRRYVIGKRSLRQVDAFAVRRGHDGHGRAKEAKLTFAVNPGN